MDETALNHYKGAIEALMFVNEKPLTIDQLKEGINELDKNDINDVLIALQADYQQRNSGLGWGEIAGGFQFLTNPQYVQYIRNFYKTKHKEKLSKPSLETLAIIAYKQPITRLDVELVRGVNSDGVVAHLLEKELIKVVGRKDGAGKPYIYGTTKQFMEYFGLKSLEDLPNLENFPRIQEIQKMAAENEGKAAADAASTEAQGPTEAALVAGQETPTAEAQTAASEGNNDEPEKTS